MLSPAGLTPVRGAVATLVRPSALRALPAAQACEICQSRRYSPLAAPTGRSTSNGVTSLSARKQRASSNRRISTSPAQHQQSQDGAPTTNQASSQKKTLPQILADAIKASGPMTVATYMRTALLDPAHGYYTSSHAPGDGIGKQQDGEGRHVLGAKGDFITSPEISQVFGELLAICFVARWQTISESLPADTQIRLVELGPGKGTLLSDILRTFTTFRDVSRRVKKIHLVETSEGLRRMQEEAIRKVVEERAGMKLRVAGAEEDPATQAAEDEVIVQWSEDVHSVPIGE
jgi:Putative S-adenosyl-L-methionine-dependent methyltransferase